MSIDGEHDIEALKRVGAIVREARDTMGKAVRAGMTTAELDDVGRRVLDKHGARSAPQLAYRFPAATCISVNDAIAHGIPSPEVVLCEGDLVNVDVSAELDGYFGDTGASFGVGRIAPRRRALLQATKAALADALAEVRAGRPIAVIGRAVERRARKAGFKVLRDLCGHGVGRAIHEKPDVPNVVDPTSRDMLTDGLVIAIEPFLTTGATRVVEDEDGWTLRTRDGSIGAQFEHTVIVTRNGPLVMT